MKTKKHLFIFLVLTLFLISGFLCGESAEDIEKGKVLEKIVCRHDSSQSYALYLPTKYSHDKKWPVLFAFDPAARATLPPNLFKNSAEKYNYIVACPTNVRNGPRKPVVDAMRAVWKDVCSRFSLDKKRIYAAGFSGGSRMSSFFNIAVNHPVRGIIGCGAGLSQVIKPEQVYPTAYFGIVGFADFNYIEMKELDHAFDNHNITHRFIYFNAKHRWPPESLCNRAVEWMEVQAVKQGLLSRNQTFIDEIFRNELKLAGELESSNIYFAVLAYECAARDFKDTVPGIEIEKINRKITLLKETREFKKFQKEEDRRYQKEKEYIKTFAGTFAFIKQSKPGDVRLQRLLAILGIKRLEQEAEKKKNIYDGGQAERLLYNVGNKARLEGTTYLDNGDYKRAVIFLEIAAASSKGTYFYAYVLYKLSSAYAAQNKKKKALKLFKKAVENGYTHLSAIEANKHLDGLLDNPEFKKIIRRLKDKGKK